MQTHSFFNFYKKYLSKLFFALGARCRYYPSCSEYTYLAVERYGTFKGLSKGILRVCRCNQFFKGGVDLP